MTSEDRYILEPLVNDGKRVPRLEIDEFMADDAMVNLFLLALRKMYDGSLTEIGEPGKRKPDFLKYYALAGIHGEPGEEWDGIPRNLPDSPHYCHHAKDTFPTWHRLYVMLYEAAIEFNMRQIASEYKRAEDRSQYMDAAARFRLPYWDLLMPRYKFEAIPKLQQLWGLPQLLAKEKVYLRHPDSPDTLTEEDNPMFQFSFPSDKEWNLPREVSRKRLEIDPQLNSNHTVRCPDTDNKSNIQNLEETIRRQGSIFARSLLRMLSPNWKERVPGTDISVAVNPTRTWHSFANRSVEGEDIDHVYLGTESLEAWHDRIHVLIGTGNGFDGHMGWSEYAGFDPIFWMHHCNIDRLLSLYQALYSRNVEGDKVDLQLVPFKKDSKKTCFTSADGIIKNYWAPGFAVPGSIEMDTQKAKTVVDKYLTQTYYWAAIEEMGREGDDLSMWNEVVTDPDRHGIEILSKWPKDLSQSEALTGNAKLPQASGPVQMTGVKVEDNKPVLVDRQVTLTPNLERTVEETPIRTAEILGQVRKINEAARMDPSLMQLWNATVRVRKFAMDGSFNVHLFIGWVKDGQPERYLTKKNEVGFTGVFASGAEANCESCRKDRENDILVEDVIPLTGYVQDYLVQRPKSRGLIAVGDIKTIESLDPSQVVPFLTEHLRWRMTNLRSELLRDREQEAKLEVTVTHQTYTPPEVGNLMGSYGPPTVYPEITSGKPGGYGHVYARGA